jgi:hypothetical protein
LSREPQSHDGPPTPITSNIEVAGDSDLSSDHENQNNGDTIIVVSGQRSASPDPNAKASEQGIIITKRLQLREDVQRTEQLAAAQANITMPRPQIPESSITIQLRSRRFVRNWPALAFTFLVFLTVIFVTLYWLEALPAAKWHTLLFNNPSNTIFTVAILSAFTVIFLDKLVAVACDTLRWSLATREGTGIGLLDFSALGNITPLGLIILLVMPGKGGNLTDNLPHASFRLWAALRYTCL